MRSIGIAWSGKNVRQPNADRGGGREGRRRQKVVRVPELSSELMSFGAFYSFQPEKVSKDVAEREYDAYKAQWEERANKAFFIEHKVLIHSLRTTRGSNSATTLKFWTPLNAKGRKGSSKALRSSQQSSKTARLTTSICQSENTYAVPHSDAARICLQ